MVYVHVHVASQPKVEHQASQPKVEHQIDEHNESTEHRAGGEGSGGRGEERRGGERRGILVTSAEINKCIHEGQKEM